MSGTYTKKCKGVAGQFHIYEVYNELIKQNYLHKAWQIDLPTEQT